MLKKLAERMRPPSSGLTIASRINVFFFITFCLFSVLILRLAMLQFVESQHLKDEEANHKNTPIPPTRGNIFDRKGAPIAYTTPTQSLYFRIEQGQTQDEIIALARELERIFSERGAPSPKKLSAEDIIRLMDVGYDLTKQETKKPSFYFVPRRIKTDLTRDEIAYIGEWRDQLKWVQVIEESTRTYDRENTVAVQLVGYLKPFPAAREPNNGLPFYKTKENTEGYVDTEDVGFDGIELMYQKELRGESGYKAFPVNAANKIAGPEVTLQAPKKGNHLYLTIDKNVQLITEQAIMDHLAALQSSGNRFAYAPNARAGYAVAMEVKTGKVVAMASMPDYDPNLWIGGISKSDYDSILPFVNNGTITTAYGNFPEDERNKHPTSIVYMGSTIKPLSVLIGFKEGLIHPGTQYYDTGEFTYGKDNSRLTNSDRAAYGWLTPATAIAHSSNTFMSAKIGNALHSKYGEKSVDVWQDYLAKFGLGVSTQSGLPREYKGANEFKTNKSESFQSRMVFASWGQNERYTTLQLAQFAATLATRGKRLKPLLVDKIESYDRGQLIQKFDEPVVLDETEFAAAEWNAVLQGMADVKVQGFDGFPYPFAKKTGTSTQSVGKKLVDNAVFIAFAPLDNPTLAVAVVVPEGGFGAWGAAPIARKIFDAYDQYYGLDGVPKGAKAAGDK
ncbi:cell division protein FtsI [Paenibacillus elgii]|uniref:Cell division protein FtsI n=1 Tax=Paenibacillus elgii TaxID=189691 RepID=A0A2T6FYY0_9BACL|nr:penicillin-binding transpeptidase domain-containing protein [Paenibacillus elgii]PUA37117.1 cell division protein FtsI [Paenibacillus elgii]